MVAPGNPKGVGDGLSVCGLKLATYSTSETYKSGLEAASKKCTDAGKPAIKLSYFPGGATSSITAGRIDGFGDAEVANVLTAQSSDGTVDSANSDVVPPITYGFGVSKDNVELANRLAEGLDKVIASGELKKLWSARAPIPDSAYLEHATINLKPYPIS